jgi:hypothetical protein
LSSLELHCFRDAHPARSQTLSDRPHGLDRFGLDLSRALQQVTQWHPRHRAIVGRVLGAEWAVPVTMAVGALEVMLGLWALSRWRRRECAWVQTLAIAAMNTLEIARARDLLISAPGMLLLNATFLAVVWVWALAPDARSDR